VSFLGHIIFHFLVSFQTGETLTGFIILHTHLHIQWIFYRLLDFFIIFHYEKLHKI